MDDTSQDIVRIEGISKSFGPNLVLQDIHLSFRAGEVHGLLGQNGAGKSTLGKIIGGVYRPDGGALFVNGIDSTGWTTRKALLSGVATIQQELSLVPGRSVAENVFLGIEQNRHGMLTGSLRRRFDELEERCHFGLKAETRVRDLRVAEQQKVEILRALAREAKVIIMDEPASSLTADEVERLHAVINQLRCEGRTVIYITHSLGAALATCDRVTVLRDGRWVTTARSVDMTEEKLVEKMLGRPTDVAYSPRRSLALPNRKVLEVSNLIGGPLVSGATLEVHSGEIVGLAGLVGSGRTELARLIYGADKMRAGDINYLGEQFIPRSPRDSISRGIVMIPEDRKKQGLTLSHSVQRNIGLPAASSFRGTTGLSNMKEKRRAEETVSRLGVVPANVRSAVGSLSGGNQQKVLFGRWISTSPQLIILDEPTRGVDVGARLQIFGLIQDLASSGAAILLISSDLEEVLGLSHRVYLMRDGRTVGEIDPSTSAVDDVLGTLFGVFKSSASGVDQ